MEKNTTKITIKTPQVSNADINLKSIPSDVSQPENQPTIEKGVPDHNDNAKSTTTTKTTTTTTTRNDPEFWKTESASDLQANANDLENKMEMEKKQRKQDGAPVKE